jgi:hypothetical protein
VLIHVPPQSSSRLTFQSWTIQGTALAEALWCDPEVTYSFGGAMTPEQAHDRLQTECDISGPAKKLPPSRSISQAWLLLPERA